MEEKEKTYLSLLKESELYGGALTDKDFKIIEDLCEGLDDLTMADKYKISRAKIKRFVSKLNRKICLHIEDFLTFYVDLKRKEFDLKRKEFDLNEREKKLEALEENKQLVDQHEGVSYPDDFFWPLRKFAIKNNISTRTLNCLLAHGIEIMVDVLPLTWMDLINIRHFGVVSLLEIQTVLEKYGFELRDRLDSDEWIRQNIKEKKK